MKLLLVEDEAAVRRMAASGLARAGFTVDTVDTIRDADAAIDVHSYDLLVLDRELPDGDGLDFLARLRRKSSIPVICISAIKRSIEDRVGGLDKGADDYLTKPFSPFELVARARAVLRRPASIEEEVLGLGNVELSLSDRNLSVNGRAVRMAARELGVLEVLMRADGRIVPRERIEHDSYSFDKEVTLNALDVAIHRLRRELKKHGATIAIRTMRGLGYSLEACE